MKASKKIIGAAFALVIAIVVATGTTFAWFTTGRTVSVGTVSLQVGSDTDGLLVSVKTATNTWSDWNSTIAQDDVNTAINFNYNAGTATTIDSKIKLMPVTTTDGAKLTEKDKSEALAATTGKFVQFDLRFRSISAYGVYLFDGTNPGSGDTATAADITAGDVPTYPDSKANAWEAIAANKYGDHAEYAAKAKLVARAKDAARVSFTSNAVSKIWAPHEEGYTAKAGNYKTVDNSNLANDFYANFVGATTKPTIPAATIATEDKVGKSGSLFVDRVDGANKQATTEQFYNKLASLVQGDDGIYTAEVTVKVWLEGWDGDCLNNVMEDNFNVILSFIGLTDPAAPIT